ncbi:MAG: LppP/LprE family lipoprotein [Candidatus Binatia bacterium]
MRRLTCAAGLLLAATAAAADPPGAWLDRPLENWNRPGASVPAAPAPDGDAATVARCKDQVRPPSTAADRAVVAAGWTLFGPLQVWGAVSVLTANASVDGMCRPTQYQGFVFLGDRFAGTIAPQVMNARTDGAETTLSLYGPTNLVAEFQRYADSDPLCCPTRTSTVTYQTATGADGPLLVGATASTAANTP